MYLCCVRSSASGYLYGESYSEDKVLEKIQKFEKIEKLKKIHGILIRKTAFVAWASLPGA